jgi:hypothetical protein
MTYRVIRDIAANAEIEDFGSYAADYTEEFARKQFSRLNRVFSVELAESPNTWNYFYITGAPYRAYLFRVGRRTSFWIVYTVDDVTKVVKVLRFWNASKEPATFEIGSTRK